MVYPANEGVAESGSSCDCDCVPESFSCDDDVSGSGCVCGISVTGTPLRVWRRGGMIEGDCDGGVRMSSRRGLGMFFGGGLEGDVEVGEGMMEAL